MYKSANNSSRIPECYKKYLITQDPQHCHISERCKGWGCKYLLSISAQNTCDVLTYWYQFGHFADDSYSKWIVDKQDISAALQKEILKLGLSQCPKFDSKEVAATLDLLPSEIFIDNTNWTLMADVYTGEIAGIAHFEEFPPDAELEDLISTVDWDSLWNSVFPADTPNNTPKEKLIPDNQRDNQEVSQTNSTLAGSAYFYSLLFFLVINHSFVGV